MKYYLDGDTFYAVPFQKLPLLPGMSGFTIAVVAICKAGTTDKQVVRVNLSKPSKSDRAIEADLISFWQISG